MQNFADEGIEMAVNGFFMLIFVLAMGIYVITIHYQDSCALQYKRKWLYAEKEVSLVAGKYMP